MDVVGKAEQYFFFLLSPLTLCTYKSERFNATTMEQKKHEKNG